ncbi:MAG: hypothetical protein ACOWWM_01850 [Desulfobacterales bacterium]
MLDVAYAYRRYQFLGDEFLTWLWFVVDNRYALLREVDPEIDALEIGSRMVLQNRRANEGIETLTIKGDNADLEEARLALKKGAMVSEIHLVYRAGEQEWQFSLKGESLNLSNLKTPETGRVESSDELEGAVIEKLFLYGKVTELIRELFRRFIRIRIANEWKDSEIPAIRKWLDAKNTVGGAE